MWPVPVPGKFEWSRFCEPIENRLVSDQVCVRTVSAALYDQ